LFRVPILARQAVGVATTTTTMPPSKDRYAALEELDIQLNTAKEAELTAACNPPAQRRLGRYARSYMWLWWEGYTPLSPLKFQLHFLL